MTYGVRGWDGGGFVGRSCLGRAHVSLELAGHCVPWKAAL